MPDRADPDFPEILGSQLWQYSGINRIVAKRGFVLLQSEPVEPGCDIHACLPDAIFAAFLYLSADCRRGRRFALRTGPRAWES